MTQRPEQTGSLRPDHRHVDLRALGGDLRRGLQVLVRSFLAVGLVLLLAALVALGIVFPLWLAATTFTAVYTIAVLVLLGLVMIAAVVLRIRSQLRTVTSEEERRAAVMRRLRGLGLGAALLGVYAGAALAFSLNPFIGVPLVIISIAAVLLLLGKRSRSIRSESGA